jgi:hypothetical protein
MKAAKQSRNRHESPARKSSNAHGFSGCGGRAVVDAPVSVIEQSLY